MIDSILRKRKPRTKKPGRPRKNHGSQQDNALNLKQRILEAATGLIAERGFDAFTLRDVAQVVGVHTALVGYYFGTKGKLEQEVIEGQLKKSERVFLDITAVESIPPKEALKAIFMSGIRAMVQDQINYRVMLWILAKGGRYHEQLNSRLISPAIELVSGLIQKLLPEISQSESDARAALFFCLSDGCSHLYWSFLKDLKIKGCSRDEFLETYYRLIEHQLLPELLRTHSLTHQ